MQARNRIGRKLAGDGAFAFLMRQKGLAKGASGKDIYVLLRFDQLVS